MKITRRLGLLTVPALVAGWALKPARSGVPGQERRSLPRDQKMGLVVSLAYSPDGRTLASGSGRSRGRDGTVLLWDAASMRVCATFQGPEEDEPTVNCVAFSPDGRTLASIHDVKVINLWDVPEGRQRAVLPSRDSASLYLAYSPDGKTLASANGFPSSVALWDLAAGTAKVIFRGHASMITGLAFAPDGQAVATSSRDKTVKTWDTTTGREMLSLRCQIDVLAVAYSPDGKTLASGEHDGTIRLWDAATGQERVAWRGHERLIHDVAFLPGGKALVSTGKDSCIRLWDAATGQGRAMARFGLLAHCMAVSPDGKTVAVGGYSYDPVFGAIELFETDGTTIRARRP